MPYFDGVPNEDVHQCKECRAVYTKQHIKQDEFSVREKLLCPKCQGLMQPAFYRPEKPSEPA